MQFKFDKLTGKFIEDDTLKKLGRQAITVYTGSVLVLDNVVFNKETKRYTGIKNNGLSITLKPSQILCIEGVA